MRVYSVTPAEGAIEGTAFFTNQVDAFKCARSIAAEGTTATVERDTVLPGKSADVLVALLNRSGWSIANEVVRVFPAKEVKIP